jgi:hypothetical protein
MMKSPNAITLLILCCLSAFSASIANAAAEPLKVNEVIEKTLAAVKATNILSFTFTKSERMNGVMEKGSSNIKLENNPFKLYLKTLGPDGGKELLFASGTNDNKATVKPNAFPYVTLKLDPYGSLLRDKQHHTVFEIGFTYFAKIMHTYSQKIAYRFKDYCTIDGETEWQGKKCLVVSCNFPQFTFVKYIVKKDETLTTIATRLNISDYMMLEKNKGTVDNYDDLDEDEEILIPNLYCKKITFYVDKENFLPIRQLIYDDIGLFEEYQYANLITP